MTTEIMLKIVRTGKPGVPQFMESQGIGQDLVTEFYGHLYLVFKVLLPIKLDMIMNQNDLIMSTFGNLCNPMDCSLPGTCPWGFSRQEYKRVALSPRPPTCHQTKEDPET